MRFAEIGFRQLDRALEATAYRDLNSHQERLEKIGIAYIQYAIANQTYYRVMFSDNQLICEEYPELNQVSQKAFSVLIDVIKAGQDSQVFIAGDTIQLARVCWSLTHGLSMLAIDQQLAISSSEELLELARIATKTVSQGLNAEHK